MPLRASIFRTLGDYLSKCRDCKHNGGEEGIGPASAINGRSFALTYALPDDHEPRNIATDKHAQSVR